MIAERHRALACAGLCRTGPRRDAGGGRPPRKSRAGQVVSGQCTCQREGV